jgi:hypothetical protein
MERLSILPETVSTVKVLFGLLPIAVLLGGCFSGAGSAPAPSRAARHQEEDRLDCQAILGDAFRSSSERDWFAANCSAWPAQDFGPVALLTLPPQEAGLPPMADRATCAEINGTQYRSDAERAWYLGNCLTRYAAAVPSPRTVEPPSLQAGQASPSSGGSVSPSGNQSREDEDDEGPSQRGRGSGRSGDDD